MMFNDDHREYAVKCSQIPYRYNRDREDRVKEVKMHEMIPRHENIVEFICAWEEKDLLYIQVCAFAECGAEYAPFRWSCATFPSSNISLSMRRCQNGGYGTCSSTSSGYAGAQSGGLMQWLTRFRLCIIWTRTTLCTPT